MSFWTCLFATFCPITLICAFEHEFRIYNWSLQNQETFSSFSNGSWRTWWSEREKVLNLIKHLLLCSLLHAFVWVEILHAVCVKYKASVWSAEVSSCPHSVHPSSPQPGRVVTLVEDQEVSVIMSGGARFIFLQTLVILLLLFLLTRVRQLLSLCYMGFMQLIHMFFSDRPCRHCPICSMPVNPHQSLRAQSYRMLLFLTAVAKRVLVTVIRAALNSVSGLHVAHWQTNTDTSAKDCCSFHRVM